MYSRKNARKVERNTYNGKQDNQKATGKDIHKKSSNNPGKKVGKKEIGKGKWKEVG